MTAPDADLVARACRCGEGVSVPLENAEMGAPVLCGACLLLDARRACAQCGWPVHEDGVRWCPRCGADLPVRPSSDPVHVSEIVPAVVEAAERGRG